MDRTATFYSRPSYVSGAGSIYAGARRQRGGSILGAIKSIVTPLISDIGRTLGRNAVKNAVGFASDVVGDLASGQNVKNSLIQRGKERGLRTLKQTFVTRGNKQTPKRLNTRRRKQRGSGKKRTKKRATSRKPSRKRRASRKRMPSAKRRRFNF